MAKRIVIKIIKWALTVAWVLLLFYWVTLTGWRTYPLAEDWLFLGPWATLFILIIMGLGWIEDKTQGE